LEPDFKTALTAIKRRKDLYQDITECEKLLVLSGEALRNMEGRRALTSSSPEMQQRPAQ
jgi:hypothetical protein